MKIVFFGTPDYVVPVLNTLHKEFVSGPGKSPIVAVVTASPKPVGRKQILTYSPVDNWAHERGIPAYHSSSEFMKDKVEADIGVLASYSEIIPQSVLSNFPQGILNIHPSLLPKLRGASPIQGAIITEGNKTGVTIMKMDEKLDHGPIVSQFKEEILPTDDSVTLRDRLFDRSKDVLAELLEPYLKGKIRLKKQDDTDATFTRKISSEDGFIDADILEKALRGAEPTEIWRIPFVQGLELPPTPENIERFVRAMRPWPGVWTKIKLDNIEKRLKILSSHAENNHLVFDEVQLEGKNPVPWRQFLLSYKSPFNASNIS
jgi:methionyl-tRNA formyltransferase